MSRHGSLCRDIVHKLQRVAGSQKEFSWSRQICLLFGFLSLWGPSLCRDSVLFSIMTMSLQRVPCRTETAEARGQGCDRSLAGAKEFQVATENFSVMTGLTELCRDRAILC